MASSSSFSLLSAIESSPQDDITWQFDPLTGAEEMISSIEPLRPPGSEAPLTSYDQNNQPPAPRTSFVTEALFTAFQRNQENEQLIQNNSLLASHRSLVQTSKEQAARIEHLTKENNHLTTFIEQRLKIDTQPIVAPLEKHSGCSCSCFVKISVVALSILFGSWALYTHPSAIEQPFETCQSLLLNLSIVKSVLPFFYR